MYQPLQLLQVLSVPIPIHLLAFSTCTLVSKTQHGNLSLVHQPSQIAQCHTPYAPWLTEQLPVVNASTFQVKFLTASIEVCAGCRNGCGKDYFHNHTTFV